MISLDKDKNLRTGNLVKYKTLVNFIEQLTNFVLDC